ncbi:DNA topoisomerase IV, alpha subunit [Ophiobolus disseminans]|uniref:DNA topoisomerase (ATP-hydrolyzing) n=1 Tax=Ophiobolus disseminans TaxID=1469910 RepID=A0A6A7A1A7_9PLEO|nr:DNA topoisomerase IV, alpha subunit [Ophiobolus disseminans]
MWVVARIEAMLERIVDGLLEESDSLTITLKSRTGLSRRRANAASADGKLPEPKKRDINFPGASAQEAWNFTVLLRILELIHGGLIDNTIMTKRDVYYRHPDLFVKQAVVDRYVDDLACTFGITRSQLNVTAAAKGLVAGSFKITRQDGHLVDAIKDKEGLLVPKIGEHDTLDLTSIQWILVIEKEATFRSLLSSSQWDTLGSQGLVLTAKGYPDVASRTFLRHVADHAPHVPMYALVDLDPDGVAILSTYKYGSYRLAHEGVTPSDTPGLILPHIRWLGVKSHHISRTPVGESDTDTSTMPELQGLMKLTARDRTKAVRMLEWDLCAEDGPEQAWRQELQSMLMLNIKAEMQILDELPGGLVSWVNGALKKGCEQSPESSVDSSWLDDGMLF